MTTIRKTLRSVTVRAPLWNGKDEIDAPARYVDVSAVSRDDLAIQSVATLPLDELPSRARKFVRAGDTLFATVRPGLRRVAMVPPKLGGALASTAFCVLRPDPAQVDPAYLFFAATSDSFVQRVADLQTGASYPAVRDRDVLDQEIDLPDPTEQRTIGGVLTFVWNSVQREGRLIADAEALKRVAMRELFTRGLRGEAQKETAVGPFPEVWNLVRLGDLGRVGNGSTPKKSKSEFWQGGSYPWLTSAKVYDRNIVGADHFVTETALNECHLPRLAPGTVLVAITGQGKTLGHCAVLRMEATINQHIAYIAVDAARADPSFIRGYLETQYAYFRQVGAGGGSTKGALTCAFLRDLPVPLPPSVDEQREIVEILDAIDQKIGLHKRKKAVLEELFKALLHKLMTGEIRVSDLDLSALESKGQ